MNEAGRMVEYWWKEMPNHFNNILIDEYIVMPDHFHGILKIEKGLRNEAGGFKNEAGGHIGPPVRKYFSNNLLINPDSVGVDRCVDPNGLKNIKLGDVIQWFKTMTTNDYLKNIKNQNWARFNKRLWQRNFYEKIVRNKLEMDNIRKYLRTIPKNLFKISQTIYPEGDAGGKFGDFQTVEMGVKIIHQLQFVTLIVGSKKKYPVVVFFIFINLIDCFF